MSLWSRFLDWILGVKVISLDDLKAIEDESLTQLEDMFSHLNSTIDRDKDGMISVREAWALLKGIFSILKSSIKRFMR